MNRKNRQISQQTSLMLHTCSSELSLLFPEEEEHWSPKEAEVNRVYVCKTSLATP